MFLQVYFWDPLMINMQEMCSLYLTKYWTIDITYGCTISRKYLGNLFATFLNTLYNPPSMKWVVIDEMTRMMQYLECHLKTSFVMLFQPMLLPLRTYFKFVFASSSMRFASNSWLFSHPRYIQPYNKTYGVL